MSRVFRTFGRDPKTGHITFEDVLDFMKEHGDEADGQVLSLLLLFAVSARAELFAHSSVCRCAGRVGPVWPLDAQRFHGAEAVIELVLDCVDESCTQGRLFTTSVAELANRLHQVPARIRTPLRLHDQILTWPHHTTIVSNHRRLKHPGRQKHLSEFEHDCLARRSGHRLSSVHKALPTTQQQPEHSRQQRSVARTSFPDHGSFRRAS